MDINETIYIKTLLFNLKDKEKLEFGTLGSKYDMIRITKDRYWYLIETYKGFWRMDTITKILIEVSNILSEYKIRYIKHTGGW